MVNVRWLSQPGWVSTATAWTEAANESASACCRKAQWISTVPVPAIDRERIFALGFKVLHQAGDEATEQIRPFVVRDDAGHQMRCGAVDHKL
jgi:hypothetical protein